MSVSELRVGVDLGGTKIAVGAVTPAGQVVAEEAASTPVSDGFEAVVERIASLVLTCLGARRPTLVGVAAAGQVDLGTGVVRYAPNLDWTDAPLGRALSERLGVGVAVDNDVRAATLGEYMFGVDRPPTTFYNVYAGTGVGSGYVCYGRILRGHTNSAGEIGHHTVRFDGPRCRCGNYGCLELYASGSGLTRRAIEAVREGRRSKLLDLAGGDPAKVDSRMVGQAAREGDALAGELVRETGVFLGVGLANVVNMFNPEVLMVGGGLVGLGEELVGQAKRTMEERALPGCGAQTRFMVSRMGVTAAIVGASCLGLVDPFGKLRE